MTTPTLDPRFADALHDALVDHVNAGPARARRRRRRVIATSLLGVGLAGGGVAVATKVFPLPGGDIVTTLGEQVTVTRTGAADVDLGTAPAVATSIEFDLTCQSSGTYSIDGVGSGMCTAGDVTSGTATLATGQHTFVVRADAGLTWTLTASYSRHEPTAWATNAAGDTYGIITDNGEPDLIAVTATNGKDGYVYKRDLEDADGTTAQKSFTSPEDALEWQATEGQLDHSVPVYLSDGTTEVGVFVVAGAVTQEQARETAAQDVQGG